MSTTYNADLFDFNFTQSLLAFVRASTFVTEHGYTVVGEDAAFDPSTLTEWVQIVWVSFGPRMTSQNSFHVRFFFRPKATDRYGRARELMIGRFKNILATATVPLYDYTSSDTSFPALTYLGEAMHMNIRFGDRGPVMDAEAMMEASSPVKGVHVVVLSYNAWVARPHEIH